MIAIGSDHGGYELKEALKKHLDDIGVAYEDCGCYDTNSIDYAVIAKKVCDSITAGKCDKGILVCGTGIGMSMAANKVKGIRAAVCGDCFSAKFTRLHNDANVLCLGARVVGVGLATEIVDLYINTPFEGGRHARRVAQIAAIEDGTFEG
ncbi:MAG: ribose 5-phosphate isomerase B [Oscillospiraceae bacterium]|nr:ribose 5-phosphate isomerase B [Oscillospiraceae bacterium]MBQ9938415.1 ribose 5-phosphate isomerase B [Oscillospiraceae bacterium]